MSRWIILCFSILYSLSASSERIVIEGRPLGLMPHAGYYTLAQGYREKNEYYFVNLAGTARVCYLDKKPELVSLDTVQIVVEEQGRKLRWNCYQYDPRFFEVDY